MAIEDLIKLCERRWAIPVLCALADGAPTRAYPLALHMKAGRASITESLQHLIRLGYVRKPAGHSHPLQPDIYLTESGRALAAAAATYVRCIHKLPVLGARPLGKWALPALASACAPVRFNDLRRSLPGITDRALSLTLHELEAKTLLDYRQRPGIRPAIGLYRATRCGRDMVAGMVPAA